MEETISGAIARSCFRKLESNLAVAIGGIDATRLPDVIAAVARNCAVVRAACQSEDPYSTILKLAEP